MFGDRADRRQPQRLPALRRVQREPVPAERVEMRAAGDQHHVLPGRRQAATDYSTDSARTHDHPTHTDESMSHLAVRSRPVSMTIIADPVWPVLVLAAIQYVDAAMCARPVDAVRRCLDDVHAPPLVRRLLTPIKLAAGTGLLLGLVVPYLGVLTCAALVAYFAIAVGMHLRARDLRRNFRNAVGLGVLSGLVSLCYL
ncbi:hypothetical protein Ais01nite_46100 [Asanoa ishikariensis]|nr:hypothetical protein Ais01nite_46100 [Asanoa ishikariensis]